MNKREFLKTITVAAAGGILGAEVNHSPNINAPSVITPSRAKDILARGVIRAGYIVLPPEMQRDPNTGKMSGIAYDLTEALAKKLHLKVEWVEELNFASMHEGLALGRFDMICFTLYRRANLGRVISFSRPLFYSGNGVYVRAEDQRFGQDLSIINDPAYVIAAMDGEITADLAGEHFPLARSLNLPAGSDIAQLLLQVTTRKADVALVNNTIAQLFMRQHPGQLRNLAANQPLAVYAHGFGLPLAETELQQMVDLAFDQMLENGQLDRILGQYEPTPGSYLRLATPYRLSA
jgi:ABC-type amino acid transport substrate-binding protein